MSLNLLYAFLLLDCKKQHPLPRIIFDTVSRYGSCVCIHPRCLLVIDNFRKYDNQYDHDENVKFHRVIGNVLHAHKVFQISTRIDHPCKLDLTTNSCHTTGVNDSSRAKCLVHQNFDRIKCLCRAGLDFRMKFLDLHASKLTNYFLQVSAKSRLELLLYSYMIPYMNEERHAYLISLCIPMHIPMPAHRYSGFK